MAKALNHQAHNSTHGVLNNNSLAASAGPTAKGKASFANELAQVKAEAGVERGNGPDINAILQQAQAAKPGQKLTQQDAMKALGQVLSQAQGELKNLRDQEMVKQTREVAQAEQASQDAEEVTTKFHSSESTMAAASQENQKQITEAAMQGNVAEREAQQQDANDRKKQLANWEDLAPKIVEDPVNKAVRIDIPGIEDIETLIVRMRPDGVAIQAVGSESAMAKLQNAEAALGAKLSQHNVKLSSLQAFDMANLAAKKAQAQKAMAAKRKQAVAA